MFQVQCFKFNVPSSMFHSLNDVCLWNDKLYYGILFKAVWETLRLSDIRITVWKAVLLPCCILEDRT